MIFALAGIVPATLVAGNFRQLKQPVQYPPLHEKGGASKKFVELERLFRYASGYSHANWSRSFRNALTVMFLSRAA